METVFIYGEIGWDVTPEGVREQLAAAKGADVELRIHSPGGSVMDGVAIITALQEYEGNVTARVDGFAGSMAAVIALAAARLSMPENAWIMFHEVSAGGGGKAADLERQLAIVKQMNEWMVRALSARTGESEEEIAAKLADEIWLTGAKAAEMGIAHEVTVVLPLAAMAWAGRFGRAPEEFRVNTARGAQQVQSWEREAEWKGLTAGGGVDGRENGKEQHEMSKENKFGFWDRFRGEPERKLAKLEEEKGSLVNQVEALHGLLAEDGPVMAAVETLVEAQNGLNERLDALEGDLRKEIEDKLQAAALVELAARQGVPAGEAEQGAAEEQDDKAATAFETWEALEDEAEKHLYFMENKSAILRSYKAG